jgi:serine/threonine protein kinase
LAPEILERWPAYDVKCDTFSFGVILFLLLGGYLPFDAFASNDAKDVFERTRNGQYQFYPKRWNGISHLAKDLVAKCLTVNPNKRISAKAALNHEWMAEKLALPTTQISLESLASTVKRAEMAKEDRRKQREATNKVRLLQVTLRNGNLLYTPHIIGLRQPLHSNRLQELNDDFTVFLETRQADSIVSHVTGAGRSVATVATQFKEDSPGGLPCNNYYQKGDQLGRGSFASVYRCKHRRTGMQYAMKEVVTSKLNKAEISTLQEEIVNLKYLRGAPYIIRLYDVFSEPDKTYLIFEEMRGGDLLHRICDKEVYTEREARDLCKILFYAVDYCHKKNIAHRDIKLDNLLLLVSKGWWREDQNWPSRFPLTLESRVRRRKATMRASSSLTLAFQRK